MNPCPERPDSLSLHEQRETILRKRKGLHQSASRFVQDIHQFRLGGRELRAPQVEAAINFEAWLRTVSQRAAPAMGRVVAPPGMGKTATAVLLTQMVGGKAVYITHTKHQGEDAKDEFQKHYSSFPDNQMPTIGRCFGGHRETHADVIVGHFSGWENWGDLVDWSQMGVIFADEADVNALSPLRVEILQKLAKEYGIPILGLSATEYQASGKKLSDVFPDEVLYMPVPKTLPQLREKELIPHLRFKDIILDCSMSIDADQKGEIEELTVQDFIRSTAWNGKILEEYRKLCVGRGRNLKGVVVFRNNLLVKDFVRQANESGIRAAAFIGEESEEELELIKKRMDEGELDVLAGSKLLQRGFNQLDLEVVINSTLTRSPQIFWQTNGRGMRFNPFQPDRVVDVLVVVPRIIVDRRTGRELPSYHRPLCNAAFFDQDYYPPVRKLSHPDAVLHSAPQKVLSLALPDVNFIRSIDEVIQLIGDYHRKPPDFIGRPRLIGEAICSLQELTLKNLKKILRIPPEVRQSTEMGTIGHLRMSEIYPYDWENELTRAEERSLLKLYMAGRNAEPYSEEYRNSEKALERILKTHEPVLYAFAHAFAPHQSAVDDFIQEGRGEMVKAMKGFSLEKLRGRLVSFFVKSLFWHLKRYATEVSDAFRVPDHFRLQVEKIGALFQSFYKEYNRYPQQDEIEGLITQGKIRCKPETLRLIYQWLLSPPETEDVEPYAEIIPEDLDEDVSVPVLHSALREALLKILKTLSYREREVLKFRFGLQEQDVRLVYLEVQPSNFSHEASKKTGKKKKNEPAEIVVMKKKSEALTLDEVAHFFNVSRERIRQIEAGAIQKLRLPVRKEKLRPFLD